VRGSELTHGALSNLGGALFAQRKYDENLRVVASIAGRFVRKVR